jgi:hypothetical protein
MKKSYFIFILIISLFSHSTGLGQAGQSGLTFLKLGVGGRALGMGEAYTAVAADPSAIYYNPAGVAFLSSSNIMLMHKEWFQDVKTEYLAGQTVLSHVVVGLSINETSVNDIQIRENPGPALGTFDARNAAVGLTAAYAFDSSFSIGLTGKYLYEKILVDEANGFAIDIGSVYKTPWNLSIGVSASNLGSMSELQTESSSLPTIYRGGLSYATALPQLSGSITLASDIVVFSQDKISHVHLGAEYMYGSTFAIRAGYQTGYEARSFTTGIGFHYNAFQVDYAFIPTQYDLGSTHTFSLCIEFQ